MHMFDVKFVNCSLYNAFAPDLSRVKKVSF